jgi:hypothetical protein
MLFQLNIIKQPSPYLDKHFLTYKVIYIEDIILKTYILLHHHVVNVEYY